MNKYKKYWNIEKCVYKTRRGHLKNRDYRKMFKMRHLYGFSGTVIVYSRRTFEHFYDAGWGLPF